MPWVQAVRKVKRTAWFRLRDSSQREKYELGAYADRVDAAEVVEIA